jgi:amidase
MLDTRADGSAIDPECRTAVLDAARLLDSLGHDVAPAFPAALADPDVSRRFSAMWSTNMAVSMERIAATIGRPVTADDVELMNWVQAEFARNVSGVDYALALAAVSAFRRQIQSWWRRDPSADDEGYDLLLTPTLAEPPPPIGTFANDPDRPMAPLLRSGPYVPFTPAFNMSGQPAISLPLHRTATGLPIGVHLVAAYGREDVLIRVASQLEQAAPWAHLHPPV